MKKTLVVGLFAITVFATVASASVVNGNWNTGDETGWTRWRAPWGGGEGWAVTNNGPTPPEGTLTLQGNSSFGWIQIVPCPESWICTLTADWAGQLGGAGWAEIMLWSTTDTDMANNIVRADTGNAADIAFKKDSWGMNPPTTWSWEPASLSPHPAGNGGMVHSLGYVVVALKLGGFSPPESASFDNIVLTCVPEPATVLLLGFGMLLMRRRP